MIHNPADRLPIVVPQHSSRFTQQQRRHQHPSKRSQFPHYIKS